MNTDFLAQRGHPSEIKTDLGAASYELRILPDNFRSGRPKWECLFFSAEKNLVSRRLTMELMSKRTNKKYHVCARTEPRTILTRQQTGSDSDALDVLNEIYAEA